MCRSSLRVQLEAFSCTFFTDSPEYVQYLRHHVCYDFRSCKKTFTHAGVSSLRCLSFLVNRPESLLSSYFWRKITKRTTLTSIKSPLKVELIWYWTFRLSSRQLWSQRKSPIQSRSRRLTVIKMIYRHHPDLLVFSNEPNVNNRANLDLFKFKQW